MSRLLLMESILGHMALLAEKYPKKAASPVARKAKQVARQSLKMPSPASVKSLRKAA